MKKKKEYFKKITILICTIYNFYFNLFNECIIINKEIHKYQMLYISNLMLDKTNNFIWKNKTFPYLSNKLLLLT
jgi:hypothetical protein